MRTETIGNLFMAHEALGRAIEQLAGFQTLTGASAMNDHEANDLLKLIKGAGQIANDAYAAHVGRVPQASNEPARLSSTEVAGMDDTVPFDGTMTFSESTFAQLTATDRRSP